MINGESSLLIDNFVFITKEKNFFPFNVDIPVKLINKHIFSCNFMHDLSYNSI